MLFNSFSYLVFLPVVFCLYWFVFNRSLRWQNVLVLIASYLFYGYWSWKFLGLLALSTFLDYAYGFGVANANKGRAKLFLWLSVINNLGILAVFKYYNFFATQVQAGLSGLGWQTNPVLLNVMLPIGISFYTFHGMSYVFDIYRGHQKPVRNLIDYSVFVSFFPLLVAGPIERANHLLPQIQRTRSFSYTNAIYGCRLILWGLFKKIVIADGLAPIVDSIFGNYQQASSLSLILGAIAFSFQIYGDFSGYSDIALGTAKLFGFELLSNFRFPYFSRDIAEFWRRWHISLSSWFRDYLYIPLGGSKEGKFKAVRNTFIIFLVSGFWHGANWTFIFWGLLHACAFLPLLLLNRNRQYVSSVVAEERALPNGKEVWQMVSTFIFVTLAWIFFRADSIGTAFTYIKRIGTNAVSDPQQFLQGSQQFIIFAYIIPLIIGDWWLRRDERHLHLPVILKSPVATTIFKTALYWGIIVLLLWYSSDSDTSFIYFQF